MFSYKPAINQRTLALLLLIAVTVFLTTTAIKAADEITTQERVVHFPPNQSLGKLLIQDADAKRHIEGFYYHIDGTEWEYLCEAKGDVTVPAGKRLMLHTNEAAAKDLSAFSRLGANDLHTLSLFNMDSEVDDKCMPYLAKLTGLKVLDLRNTKISSFGMKFIRNLRSLERLTLPSRITDSGMSHVAALTSLKALYFKGNRVTNEGLRHLAKLPQLEELELGRGYEDYSKEDKGRMDDAGLVHLAKLTKLRYLIIWGPFTDAGLVHLKNIPSLKILCVFNIRQCTDAGLAHLSHLTNLENLAFPWMDEITDAGMVHLKSMRSLRKLDIKSSQVTEKGLLHLKEIKSLEHLVLPNSGFTDDSLAYLSELSNLKYLRVSGSSNSPMTDVGLGHLAKLQHLEGLLIWGEGITDAGISHIAKMSHMKDLSLGYCQVTNKGLAKLAELKSLEQLFLVHMLITTSGINHLNVLTNLTDLQVSSYGQDESVLDLSDLTKLKKLILISPTLCDDDLVCLAKLKKLHWLHLGTGDGISDAGIAHLAGLTSVDDLGIGGPELTDDGLRHLAHMKKLRRLCIHGHFTDQALCHLEGFQGLETFIYGPQNSFSAPALRHLKKTLPSMLYTPSPVITNGIKRWRPKVGEMAPTFNLTSIDGQEINLEDYRGKVVLLHFWTPRCHESVASMTALQKFYEELSRQQDFALISLSRDRSEDPLRKHIEKYKPPWPQICLGRKSKVAAAYAAKQNFPPASPTYFVVGPDGKIVSRDTSWRKLREAITKALEPSQY